MKPIEIKIHGFSHQSAPEICQQILTLERWPAFTGYSILPGIKQATFETQTPNWVGSRIRVHNTDGSTHIEEILIWEPERRAVLKFQEFEAPLKHLATHFIETWTFKPAARGTEILREVRMYPSGFLGWLWLIPISHLMRKALEKNAAELTREIQTGNPASATRPK